MSKRKKIKVFTNCNYNTVKANRKANNERLRKLNEIMKPFVILDNKKLYFLSYTEIKLNINILIHKSENKKIDIFYQKPRDISEYFETWILPETGKKPKLIKKGTFFILSNKNKFIKEVCN